MKAMMDFSETLDFFGGSIFGEECRGDFTLVQSRIDNLQHEAGASSPETSDLKAKILFLRAILSLLTGNHTEASSFLFEICGPAGDFSRTWKIRAVAYCSLLITWSRFPPILRSCNALGGFAGEMVAIKSGYVKNGLKVQDMLMQVSRDGSDVDKFERQMLSLLSSVSLILHTEGTLHPSFPSILGQPPAAESDPSKLVRSLQLGAEAVNCPGVARYLSRIVLEIDIARGAPDLDEKLSDLRDEYSSARDWAGLASVYLLDADRILSPPFSNPLSLNLIVTESCSATIGNKR